MKFKLPLLQAVVRIQKLNEPAARGRETAVAGRGRTAVRALLDWAKAVIPDRPSVENLARVIGRRVIDNDALPG